ncbi:MAG: SIP domain-containing protein [Actinomycetota bacterium]
MSEGPAVTGFSTGLAHILQGAMEHLDGNHGDALSFLVEHGPIQAPSPTEVDICALDPEGVTLLVTTTRSTARHRLVFDRVVTSVADLQAQMLGFLRQARRAAPRAPLTRIERELQIMTALRTYPCVVVDRVDISPDLAQVTLGGLHGVPRVGGDEYFYVIAQQPGAPADIGGSSFSIAELRSLPAEEQPPGAWFTASRRRPDEGEVDFWVARCGDGEMARWAAESEVGDPAALWGPRRSYEPSGDAVHHVLIADETGLAAAFALADNLPRHHSIRLIVEVAAPEHRPPGPERDDVEIEWCYRGEAPPGTSGHLLDAIHARPPNLDRCSVFGAAESAEISALRRYLRHDLGFDRSQLHLTGYWQRPV